MHIRQVREGDLDWSMLTEEYEVDLNGKKAFVVYTREPGHPIFEEVWEWLDDSNITYDDYTFGTPHGVQRLWVVLSQWEQAMRFKLTWVGL